MRNTILAFAVVVIAMSVAVGCGNHGEKMALPVASTSLVNDSTIPGDSAYYGLACDGCTDSVIVVLGNLENDPDTFEIVNASINRKVLGTPKVGDLLAVIPNPTNKRQALQVINIEYLRGTWCSQVMPRLRDISQMPKRLQKRIMEEMTDSEKRALLVSKEMGMVVKKDHTIRPVGITMRATTTDEQGMVEYPEQKRYEEWRLLNGKLILKLAHKVMMSDSIHVQRQAEEQCDTADILLLTRDTLLLQIGNELQGYYRK
ncbi:MAG: hypothetical protein ACI4BA_03895 [Prevotella sp.]